MDRLKAAASAILAISDAACVQQPRTVPVNLEHAQQVPAPNTMLGEACDGHDHTAGVHLYGDSLLGLAVSLDEITPDGMRPFASGAVPADFASQSLPRPVFLQGATTATCGGVALRSHLRQDYENPDRLFLDWVLEVAILPPAAGHLPADPYRTTGTIEVLSGHGSAQTRFAAGGRPLVARLSVAPGTGWRALQAARAAHAADAAVYPSYARPLPDELPGRTLGDAVNPASGVGDSSLLRLRDDRGAAGGIQPSTVR